MLKEILLYQQKDASLVKLNKELENSREKREVNTLVEQVKQAQNKLVALEQSAGDLIKEFEKLQNAYNKKTEKLDKLKKEDLSGKTVEELREKEAHIKSEIGNLLALSKDIKNLSVKINQIVTNFDKTKQQGVDCKNKYKTSLNKFNALEEKDNAERVKIEKEMEELSKLVKPEIMKKYLELREDHKFPIMVPLTNNCCAICSTPLANARLDLLNKEGIVECENCHRIIYQKK